MTFIKEHIRIILFAGFLALFILTGSIARCVAIHPPTDPEGSSIEQAEGEGSEGSQTQKTPSQATTPTDHVPLPDEMELPEHVETNLETLRSGYTSSHEDIINMLCANVWTNPKETQSITFTEDSFSLTGESSVAIPFAIADIETAEARSDGVKIDQRSFVFVSGETPTIAHLEIQTTPLGEGKGDEVNVYIYGKAFGDAGTRWLAQKASKHVTVAEPADEILAQVGLEREELEKAFSEWCSKNLPTVSQANWISTIIYDYEEGTIRLQYAMNNRAQTLMSVYVSMEDGTFTIKKGR